MERKRKLMENKREWVYIEREGMVRKRKIKWKR